MQSTGQASTHEVSRQSRHKRVMTHVIDTSFDHLHGPPVRSEGSIAWMAESSPTRGHHPALGSAASADTGPRTSSIHPSPAIAVGNPAGRDGEEGHMPDLGRRVPRGERLTGIGPHCSFSERAHGQRHLDETLRAVVERTCLFRLTAQVRRGPVSPPDRHRGTPGTPSASAVPWFSNQPPAPNPNPAACNREGRENRRTAEPMSVGAHSGADVPIWVASARAENDILGGVRCCWAPTSPGRGEDGPTGRPAVP
jgi:hypothetical protein